MTSSVQDSIFHKPSRKNMATQDNEEVSTMKRKGLGKGEVMK